MFSLFLRSRAIFICRSHTSSHDGRPREPSPFVRGERKKRERKKREKGEKERKERNERRIDHKFNKSTNLI